jgi:hypothetical protein
MVRAVWGCALLVAPDKVLRAGTPGPVPPAAIAVARTLGTRQVLQSALSVLAPTRPVAGLGAAVDALHAGTDVGLAAVSPRWRRIALVDAAVAAALAASGWICRR